MGLGGWGERGREGVITHVQGQVVRESPADMWIHTAGRQMETEGDTPRGHTCARWWGWGGFGLGTSRLQNCPCSSQGHPGLLSCQIAFLILLTFAVAFDIA